MSSAQQTLANSPEPAIRYKARLALYGDDPAASDMRRLRANIKTCARVQRLLSERDVDGRIPGHPYRKWSGAHWTLVALADLEYPPGDTALVPLREQVYRWLLSPARRHAARHNTIDGRVRMCASMEGNAVYALLKLGLADGGSGDGRLESLVERLMTWQWPDGGWNCGISPDARTSSFHETLIPLRGLALYARMTGDTQVHAVCRRASEVFLSRRLFKRRADATIISQRFVRLHYPWYWHYDILFGLTVLGEAGLLGDARCAEALDLLEAKRLADGGFPAEEKYYRVTEPHIQGSTRSLVDWGGTSVSATNPFVTVHALSALTQARRLRARS